MSIAKSKRISKKQLGQFFTPPNIASEIVNKTNISTEFNVLEPSFGDGSFIYAVIEKIRETNGDVAVSEWCSSHLFGCENDKTAFEAFVSKWGNKNVPENLHCEDFFKFDMPSWDRNSYFLNVKQKYDLIIGNPPFGGTIDASIQDELDTIYGFRNGKKIKKETYAFFIVKCIDLLKDGGELVFICSDTIMSISTMKGLREFLMSMGKIVIEHLPGKFDETKQSMVLLRFIKGGTGINVFGNNISYGEITSTPNSSWNITNEYLKYFSGKYIGDYMVATSGMTVGCNELFLRKVENGKIMEPYIFSIAKKNITLETELNKARLGKLSKQKQAEIKKLESIGAQENIVITKKLDPPIEINLPDKNYAPYNKATNKIIYAPPSYVIYWKDEGEYVYTFKKSGNWYLHGVGGKPFFKKEGITWQLISSKINMRYLPPGYILDSGAPCAFLKPGVHKDEMYFILGWCLTNTCTKILKTVINHTRNIQSKDIERLPYPTWVSPENKAKIIKLVYDAIQSGLNGEEFNHESRVISELESLFLFRDTSLYSQTRYRQPMLF